MEQSELIQRWQEQSLPTYLELVRRMQAEGLQAYRWSNAPGDVYAAHSHEYHKVIYVLQGSITFELPLQGEQYVLNPGDRMDLPAGIIHNAVVGPQGVTCLEAQRYLTAGGS